MSPEQQALPQETPGFQHNSGYERVSKPSTLYWAVFRETLEKPVFLPEYPFSLLHHGGAKEEPLTPA